MDDINYISLLFSGGMLILAVLTFVFSRTKDRDNQRENNIKMNLKLDTLCQNTNNILVKIERQESKIQQIETEFAVMQRDLKTAFHMIEELKNP